MLIYTYLLPGIYATVQITGGATWAMREIIEAADSPSITSSHTGTYWNCTWGGRFVFCADRSLPRASNVHSPFRRSHYEYVQPVQPLKINVLHGCEPALNTLSDAGRYWVTTTISRCCLRLSVIFLR